MTTTPVTSTIYLSGTNSIIVNFADVTAILAAIANGQREMLLTVTPIGGRPMILATKNVVAVQTINQLTTAAFTAALASSAAVVGTHS